MKEASDDRTSSEGDGKSILRKILADDRAELTKVQKAYGAMLCGAGAICIDFGSGSWRTMLWIAAPR